MAGVRASKISRLARRGDTARLAQIAHSPDFVTTKDGRTLDVNTGAREQAIAALGELNDSTAVQELVKALGDPDGRIRLAATRALRRSPRPGAAQALIRPLAVWPELADEAVSLEAVEALAELQDPTMAERFTVTLVQEGRRGFDPPAEAALKRFLTGYPNAMLAANLAEVLVGFLGSRSEEIRSRAAHVLIWLGADSVPALIDALAHDDTRLVAASVLGAVGHARAVEPLIDVLRRKEPSERLVAAWALGEISDPTAVQALLLTTRDEHHAVRAEAARALDKLGTVAVIAALVGTASSGEPAPESLPSPLLAVPEATTSAFPTQGPDGPDTHTSPAGGEAGQS